MTQSNAHRNSHEQECTYSLSKNNNTTRGWLWNPYITSGNSSVIHLVEADGNQAQSDTPHGMSQPDSAPRSKSLTPAGNPLGINLSNGLPMLGNSTSAKKRY